MTLEDKFKYAKVDDNTFKNLSWLQKRKCDTLAKIEIFFSRLKRRIFHVERILK